MPRTCTCTRILLEEGMHQISLNCIQWWIQCRVQGVPPLRTLQEGCTDVQHWHFKANMSSNKTFCLNSWWIFHSMLNSIWLGKKDAKSTSMPNITWKTGMTNDKIARCTPLWNHAGSITGCIPCHPPLGCRCCAPAHSTEKKNINE